MQNQGSFGDSFESMKEGAAQIGGAVADAASAVVSSVGTAASDARTAVENMESILDVDGINGVYIGPSDLGFSYGLVPKLDRDEPEILKIYEKIIKECGKRGLYPGIHCSGAVGAARAIDMGFKLVTLSNEVGLMSTYARMQVAQTRKDSGGKA